MHIETLKIFCDLIETQSFSKTAKRNYLTQSAVSQQIKQLEVRFGKKLIERGPRSLKPTASGELFYRLAKEILDKFYQLETALSEADETISGVVKLSVIYSVGLHELPMFIKPFLKEHPHIRVHVEYSPTAKIYDDVISNMVDFAIVALPLKRRQLEVKPLFADKLVLITSKKHEFANKKKISVKKIDGLPFIAFGKTIPTRKLIDAFLESVGVKPQITAEFGNVETIKDAVEINSGVAIVPKTAVFKECKIGMFSVIELEEGSNLMRPVCLIMRKDKVFEPAVEHFIHDLQEMAAKIGTNENTFGIFALEPNAPLYLDDVVERWRNR